jgi:hypothetical protein
MGENLWLVNKNRSAKLLPLAVAFGKSNALSSVKAASVEISTEYRRIIDSVLSPIPKATSEVGRER